jgi:nitrous oxidase accessory protein NosD
MNDDARFERLFADGLHELAPRRAPDRVRTTIRAQTGETRPRARWLALIKEPTMRTNNRLAVGSPTVRVAAIMAATLLAAMMIIGAGIAGAQLFAASGPIIVDASGDGHHTTIQAAVDAAEDGDEILVRPGTYAEEITIEKDVTVRGDGPVEEVIVELADAWLFTLRETDAQITNLTLRGDGDTQGMAVVGGAPLISGLVFDGTGAPYAGTTLGDRGSLMISGGSATVADNRFLNGGEVMVGLDANAVIESNEFIDGPHLYLQDPGDDAIVRGNTFSGSFDRAMGLFGASTMTIEGNTVDGAGGDGITIGWYASPGHDPLIRDNDISGTQVGIMAFAETDPIVESNRFRDNATAIYNQSDTGTYTGNELAGNDLGIYTRGAPVLEGNSIVDGGVGIRLFGTDTSTPVMKGNTVCDNEQNVSTPELGDVPPLEYDESNEICEDPPTE